MNWDRIEGNWKQARGRVQVQWGKLTNDQLDVPAAMLVISRLVRSRREPAGPVPGWTVPLVRLESAPPGRRREPSDLSASTGPLDKPAPVGYFGLSTLGLGVLVVLGSALLLLARGWKG